MHVRGIHKVKKFEYSKQLIEDVISCFGKFHKDCSICKALKTGDPLLVNLLNLYCNSDSYEINDVYGRVLNELDAWDKLHPKPKQQQPTAPNKYFDDEVSR